MLDAHAHAMQVIYARLTPRVLQPGLYWLKYDSVTTYGLPLYLSSYKLDGSVTAGIRARFNIICHLCILNKGFCYSKLVFGNL